ncbi:hypothetical protein ACQ4PT_005203 [Festuca glaucescens]
MARSNNGQEKRPRHLSLSLFPVGRRLCPPRKLRPPSYPTPPPLHLQGLPNPAGPARPDREAEATHPSHLPYASGTLAVRAGVRPAGLPGMAYVDQAFSLTDEDDLVDGEMWGRPRGPPVKEIAFAAALLAFGALGVVAGLVMAAHQVGGDRSHGIFFTVLGVVMFIPGFYYTRIAYYAYKGYQGFSFANIPPI